MARNQEQKLARLMTKIRPHLPEGHWVEVKGKLIRKGVAYDSQFQEPKRLE